MAICVDPVEKNAAVAKKLGVDFAILSDSKLEVIDAFGLRHVGAGLEEDRPDVARPAVFLFDKDGQVLWRSLTDDWRVRVRPEELLAQLSNAK